MHNNSAAQLLEREDDAIAESGQVNSHSAQNVCVSHVFVANTYKREYGILGAMKGLCSNLHSTVGAKLV